MPGGRPERGGQHIYPELAEMAVWFQNALVSAGYPSINAFVQRHPIDKNRVYALFKGTHLYPHDVTLGVAAALVGPQKAEEVEPLWWRAKEARDRAAAAERDRQTPHLESWDKLPWPELALHDILDAQSRAADTLPYQRLGIEPPPLSTVYVRQRARPNPPRLERVDDRGDASKDGERGDDSAAEPAIAMTEALDRHEHLVVVGEPGAGKSTFGQHLVLRLSQVWLRQASAADPPIGEPVLPLRVHARALVGATSWSVALAQATREALGLLLVSDPIPAMFEHRVQGARWLVVIDGLDEIVDREAREKVVQAVAARCRPRGSYRIIVTSRQLPDSEFVSLRAHNVAFYNVEPFGPDELHDFARRWFSAQGVTASDDVADRFLRHVTEGRLRALVTNPLLATLAAIAYTLEPDRPLPASRLELFERFVACLLDDDARRATVTELRRLETSQPERYRLAEWVHRRQAELAAYLAVVRMEGERPLLGAAAEWVQQHGPGDVDPPVAWDDDLRQLLIGTGLFTVDGDGLRFWHHTLAEFLAAQAHAGRIESSFPEAETWIARASKSAERQYALLVMLLWARRPGNDVTVIVNRLLAGRPERAILAAHLVAEAMPSADVTTNVLNRLVDLAVGCSAVGQGGQWYDMTDKRTLHRVQLNEIMEPLGELIDNSLVADRLTKLVEAEYLPVTLRIAAATTLGRVAGAETALPYLEAISAQAVDNDVVEVARGMLGLTPGSAVAETLLRRHVADPEAELGSRCQALAELASLGDPGEAARTALDLMASHQLSAAEHNMAFIAVLHAGDEYRQKALSAVSTADSLTPEHWIAMAEAFTQSEMVAPAIDLARRTLNDARCSNESGRAVRVLVMHDPDLDIDQLLAALRASSSPWYRAWAAQTLAATGHDAAAVDLARSVIHDPIADHADIGIAVEAWLSSAGADALPGVLEAIQHHTRLLLDPGRTLVALVEAGFREAAIDLCRAHVSGFKLFDYYVHSVRSVVAAWLTAAGVEAAPEIGAAVRARVPATADYWASAAEGFAEHGCAEQTVEFARLALTTHQLYYSNPKIGAVQAWILAAGPQAADEVLATAGPGMAATERLALADHLAALGALKTAQAIWREALTTPRSPMDQVIIAATRIVQTGGAAEASTTRSTLPGPDGTGDQIIQALAAIIAALGQTDHR
jgi:NACHT domain